MLNSLLNPFIHAKNKVSFSRKKTLVIERARVGTEFVGSRHADIRCVLIVVDGE